MWWSIVRLLLGVCYTWSIWHHDTGEDKIFTCKEKDFSNKKLVYQLIRHLSLVQVTFYCWILSDFEALKSRKKNNQSSATYRKVCNSGHFKLSQDKKRLKNRVLISLTWCQHACVGQLCPPVVKRWRYWQEPPSPLCCRAAGVQSAAAE